MKHGITAKVLLPHGQEEAIQKRLAAWKECLQPEGEVQEFELRLAVDASLEIERCQAQELQRKIELAEIAMGIGDRWEIDRKKDVARLAKSLKRNPEEVALQLRKTPAGRTWLIERWKDLLLAVAEGAETCLDRGGLECGARPTREIAIAPRCLVGASQSVR